MCMEINPVPEQRSVGQIERMIAEQEMEHIT